MHIESIQMRNFKCFGTEAERIELDPNLTAFIGTNGTGKTATCQALQRMFGITADERTVRMDDFHVPDDEVTPPETRTLSVDIVLAFPELSNPEADTFAIPPFYRHLASTKDGEIKCRIVLESTWTNDGTIDGTVESRLFTVRSFDQHYLPEQTSPIPASERSRIQFVYVPASRDGARQVTKFLRGRLWRAAKWSDGMRKCVSETSTSIDAKFHEEGVTKAVESAFGRRWSELHGAGTLSTPRLRVFEPDVSEFLNDVDLTFEPDHSRAARPARHLSDGQKSLLHLALTTASLDLELGIDPKAEQPDFDMSTVYLPALTVLAVEEPENNLSPFYLSRIIKQLLELGESQRAQIVLSTHSASSLGRIEPETVRYFRQDAGLGRTVVKKIVLPESSDDAGKYVREAVRAHPELYFARFVILGEGDSEQVVIPAIARALGIALDPSFVAMVPLGGRHTNHFWRLLTDLGIPHATLLDLDYGRAGGGRGRIRDVINNLRDLRIEAVDALGEFEVGDPETDTGPDITILRSKLQAIGIFFSSPLDLDMMMFTHYKAAYTALAEGRTGPHSSDASSAVLGIGGSPRSRDYWQTSPEQAEALRWYRYLFSNRSKPATHLDALGRLTNKDLATPPEVLEDLVKFAGRELDKQ